MSARSGTALRIAAVAGLALAGAGCATITYDASLVDAMVAMNRVTEVADYETVGRFEVDQRPIFVIASLITVVDADLEEAIIESLARNDGDAVVNLRIHEEYDIIDFAIGAVQSVLLLGAQIVQTRAVTLEGDVVRWTGEMNQELSAVLGEQCREVAVPTGAGDSRPGWVCVPAGAAETGAAAE